MTVAMVVEETGVATRLLIQQPPAPQAPSARNFADQLQFGLKIHIVGQLDMLDKAGRLDVVAVIEDELLVLSRGSG